MILVQAWWERTWEVILLVSLMQRMLWLHAMVAVILASARSALPADCSCFVIPKRLQSRAFITKWLIGICPSASLSQLMPAFLLSGSAGICSFTLRLFALLTSIS
ncbi:hypothetical protein V6N13_066291 [Hibiscus sabdariffa]